MHNPTATSFVELDISLADFGTYLYDLNPRLVSLQHFRSALFGTIFFLPELKSHLGRSRQLEKGWDRSVPSIHMAAVATPYHCPRSMFLFASQHRYRESLALMLVFHGFLRANEICKLQKNDICFPSDFCHADFHNARAGCVVRHAKIGRNQFIHLSDLTLLRRLLCFSNSLPSSSTSLFSISYASLTMSFNEVFQFFHLGRLGYTLHSLRHGGATF